MSPRSWANLPPHRVGDAQARRGAFTYEGPLVPDYYAVLGVPPDAGRGEIRRAFRRAAARHHPDVNPGDAAARAKFKTVAEAYEVLADPAKRSRYDAFRAAPHEAGAGAGEVAVETLHTTLDAIDLQDLFRSDAPFSDFFYALTGRPREGAPAPGPEVYVDVRVTLEEAATGTTRRVEVDGAAEGSVEIRIPPGVQDGTVLRVLGEGAAGSPGGPRGDVCARVCVMSHPGFDRRGDDLFAQVPLELWAAVLGAEMRVLTPDGAAVTASVPPGLQNGTWVRLRGLGMPKLNASGRGDLYVRLDLALPSPIPAELRDVAEALHGETDGAGA